MTKSLPEIDKEVAELLGFKVVPKEEGVAAEKAHLKASYIEQGYTALAYGDMSYLDRYYTGEWLIHYEGSVPHWTSVPQYSFDLDYAFELIERLRQAGYWVGLVPVEGGWAAIRIEAGQFEIANDIHIKATTASGFGPWFNYAFDPTPAKAVCLLVLGDREEVAELFKIDNNKSS